MNNVNEPLRVACVGTGYFSQFHFEAWRRIADADVVGVTSLDVNQARGTGILAFSDLEDMLSATRPDLVDIIVPPDSQFDIIKRCAETGVRNLICQKPFCRSLDEARQAVELCEKLGIQLIVHENFRFQPWYRCMKQAIDEGMLGIAHQCTFRLRTGDGQGSDAYIRRQPYFRTMHRFLLRETAVHWLDTFTFLFGKPSSIYADLRRLNETIAGEDAGYLILGYNDGKRALFDGNRHLDHSAENHRMTLGEALLEGSEGTLSLSGSGEVRHRAFGSLETKVLLAARDWPGFAGDCVHALQSHIVEAIKTSQVPENLAREYLFILELEEAAYRSAATGEKVIL